MREVERNTSAWDALKFALDRTPMHFLGPSAKAELHKAFETSLDGIYQVFIGYDRYALSGMLFIKQPVMSFYLDYNSTLMIVQLCIEQAINASWEQATDSTGRWRYREWGL